MQQIIGRQKEREELVRLYHSGRSEFVVVYGRRRVGKTFLIREHFEGRFAFYHTGLSPAEKDTEGFDLKREQLRSFCTSLQQYGGEWDTYPADWFDAFDCLKDLLEMQSSNERLVVFIDELPWMGLESPGFLTALEHFWNNWGAACANLMLIVCGSAASWMSDNILNSTGGLYGRATFDIHLEPFSLWECEQFFQSRNISMDRYDQIQSYMVFGGIPYYLNYLQPNRSLAQNIDSLFFSKSGKLRKEFSKLYKSLFADSDKYMQIVRTLAAKRDGLTRKEIAEKTGIAYNGRLTKMLKTLVLSDFVVSYIYYGGSAKEVYYKLTDSFSLFYLKFVDNQPNVRENFWTTNLRTPQLNTWRGLAFEDVCMTHIRQIKKALGFSAVESTSSPWRSKEGKAQIDLLFDRADRVVCVCEMKFSSSEFSVDKEYDAELRRKVDRFAEETRCRKSIQLALVTTYGLTRNSYSGQFHSAITMDALFEKEA